MKRSSIDIKLSNNNIGIKKNKTDQENLLKLTGSPTGSICIIDGCTTFANFNYPYYNKPLYCKLHAGVEMTNVKDKKCMELGCLKRPSFNINGEKTPLYCKCHAKNLMIDVVHKKCQEENCNIRPVYNFPHQIKPLYCKNHIKTGMVNVIQKICQSINCTIMATFNFPGQPKPLWCKKHSLTGMIDLQNKYKQCQEINCKVISRYGYIGLRATRCAQHKLENMIPCPKRKCETETCKEFSTYGVRLIPERCEQHKQPFDRDLVLHRCHVCLEPSIIDKNGLCEQCNDRKWNIRLGRQRQVKYFLDDSKTLPRYDFYDQIAFDDSRCGKERPDFVWDCQTHQVILEVDEYQHRDRIKECETIRMINITQGFHVPCIWIRYNPDDFKGQKATLRDRHRLLYLEKILLQSFAMIPQTNNDILRVIYLFFDDFNTSQSLKFESIHCENKIK